MIKFNTFSSLFIVAIWIALAILLTMIAPRWSDVVEDSNLAYFPKHFSSSRADALLREGFKDYYGRSSIVLIVARPDAELGESDYEFADEVAKNWERVGKELKLSEGKILTSKAEIIGESFRSEDGRAILVVANVQKDFLELDLQPIARLAKQQVDLAFEKVKKEPTFKPGMEWGLTGAVILSDDLLTATRESLQRTEWITVGLVLGFVLLIYRAPLLAIVPLISIGFAWWCGLLTVTLSTQWTGLWEMIGWRPQVYTTARIIITVLVFGSGTDYCLFLIARYREELFGMPEPERAMNLTMKGVRGALWGSAVTSIVGIGLMGLADFGKFQSAGYAVSVCLVVTLLASVTLAPALLCLMGKAAFWPFDTKSMAESMIFEEGPNAAVNPGIVVRFWDKLSRSIVTHPLVWWLGGIAVLALPVYWGTRVTNRYDMIGDLSMDRPSIRGNELLGRYFPRGTTGPIEVVAVRHDAPFTDQLGKDVIYKVTGELMKLDLGEGERDESVRYPVDAVQSFSQPFGSSPSVFGFGKLMAAKTSKAKQMFLYTDAEKSQYITRWKVILNQVPYSPNAVRILGVLDAKIKALAEENEAWKNIEFVSGGSTALTSDLQKITESDQQRIERFVVIGVLFVMIVFIRRPAVCFYLMGTVMLSYFATVGISDQVFKHMHHETISGIDWKVPLFLFVVLAAVGVDYNILLVARVLEEQKKRSATDALRIGLARTGGIITSCGLIMAASFVAMIWGTLLSIKELGIAFTLGILLDTIIIRTIIVPAGWMLGIRAIEKFRSPKTLQTNTSAN